MYIHHNKEASPFSTTQHEKPPKFGGKWETEMGTKCLGWFLDPLPTMLCVRYSVKLKDKIYKTI